jgi:hypothetical protein
MKAATAVLVVLLLGLSGCDVRERREGTFERTLQVSGRVDLDLRSGAGNITVHTGDSGTVSIEARIRARDSWLGMSADKKIEEIEAHPPIEQHGNTIRVGGGNRELNKDVVFEYDLTVPPETDLKTTTGAGNQTIRGIYSRVEATSGAGNIGIEDVTGDVHVRTGAGNLDISNARRGLVAETGAGNIGAEGNPKRDWRLQTGLGNIRLQVPETASFDVDARCGLGHISMKHEFKVRGSISSNRVEGRVGDGGPSVRLENGAGNIDIN